MINKAWTRDELILALRLYCEIPFGTIHIRNPKIISLAALLARTPGAVSWKLANFAHLDPSLNRQGAGNVGKLDRMVWAEFQDQWENLLDVIEDIHAEMTIEENIYDVPVKLEERPTEYVGQSKQRRNQSFFRTMVLSGYNNTCAITGLNISRLLVASHIVPWKDSIDNRLNPRNGIALNALHDKAFDSGLISFDRNYRLILARRKLDQQSEVQQKFLLDYEGSKLLMPSRFLPDPKLLEYHRDNVFDKQISVE